MSGLLLSVLLAAPFPLPAVDGKPLAVSAGQTVFRVPMRFERVKSFYAEQLGEGASVSQKSVGGKRTLTLVAKGKSEPWVKALVREGDVDTTIQVTWVIQLAEEKISGNGKPLVEFIFGRSPEVQKALKSIDHTEPTR